MDIGYGTLPASGSYVVVQLKDFPISGMAAVGAQRIGPCTVASLHGRARLCVGRTGIDIVTDR